MPLLTIEERREVAKTFMQEDTAGLGPMRKPDLMAAIAAIDGAADAGDNGLMAPVAADFKAATNAAQKRMLKRLVMKARYG